MRKTDSSATTLDMPTDNQIVLTRTVNAAPELVWEAWTNPVHLARWWGPNGFTTTTKRMDVKAGSQWRYTMHGPDGRDYENLVTYICVDKPRQIVYRHDGDDECEAVCFETTATFEARGEQTLVTLAMRFPSKEERDNVLRYGADEGGRQTLSRLDAYLADELSAEGPSQNPVFEISRVFDAPRDLVWKAWTREEHLAEWFGPATVELTTCRLDFRVGGTLLYFMQPPEGEGHWGKWVFREIKAPERLEFVVCFADERGNPIRAPFEERWPLETLSVVTIVPHAGLSGGTTVTVRWEPLNATPEECAVFEAGFDGMGQGWGGTLDQLTDHLANHKGATS